MIHTPESTHHQPNTIAERKRKRRVTYMTVSALAGVAFLGGMFYKDHSGAGNKAKPNQAIPGRVLEELNPQHSGPYSGEVRTLGPIIADAKAHPDFYKALARIQDSIKSR